MISIASAIALFPLFAILLFYVHFRLIGSKFWSKRKIPHLKPVFLLGNTWKTGFTENFATLLQSWHLKYQKEKMIGLWSFIKPGLLITDIDLTKNILIKDFNHFRDRGIEINEEIDPLAGHLFLISGKRWRNLRAKLTPTFTSGKMKVMFPTMLKCGQELQEFVAKAAAAREIVDTSDLSARFTTDVIASCAFGLETNSIRNPNSEFRKYGKKVFEEDALVLFNNIIRFTFPILKRILRFRLFPKDVSDFFINAVKEAIEYRERTDTRRNDFLQLLIQLLKTGKIDDIDKSPIPDLDDQELVQKFSLVDAAAQCFVFFTAGFETSSVALAFALYELAINPDIQEKLHKEIDDVRDKVELTYEQLMGMEYLDKIVSETLRKHPPAGNLKRECTKDYYIPEMDVTIEKGTAILISTRGFHYDPEIYPDPDKFDPERFSKQERVKRDSFAFMPFGDGPRSCIGNRFALMQIKIGLFYVLKECAVDVADTTPVPIKINSKNFITTPVGGVPLRFHKRQLNI